MTKILTVLFCFIFSTSAMALGGVEETYNTDNPPTYAGIAGYTVRTFHSVFSNDIDLTNSKASGKNWYLFNSSGHTGNSNSLTSNTDGSLTINSTALDVSYNANISTMTPTGDGNIYVGKAFGGGAYFEAEIKVSFPSATMNSAAFWASPFCALITGSCPWEGQAAGYSHYVETDFLDGIYPASGTTFGGGYSGNMGDWYGTSGSINLGSAHLKNVDYDLNWAEYHKFGFLWVPATDAAQGYAIFCLDDKPIGQTVYWDKYTGQLPPPESPWLFSFLDTQKMIMILGTGIGEPMTVKNVSVWQKDETGNLTR